MKDWVRAGHFIERAASAAKTAEAASGEDLGRMPEWDLSDLYPAPDSPEVKTDLARAAEWAKDFETRHKGKLAGLLKGSDGAGLHGVIAEYEQLDDLFGRLWSYAGLLHATDVSDTAKSKFYGDVSEKLTAAGVHLLFFTLELNRLPDETLDAAMSKPPLDHYKPWIEDVRMEKPYQLDDELERLFHEKSVTGRGSWNRLFDETISSLTFNVDGTEMPIEPTLNKMQDSDAKVRKAAALALTKSIAIHCATEGTPIRCNAISPGVIETEMITAIIEKSGAPEAARAAYCSMSPMKRMGSVDEIAALVAFLASDEAGFINGAEYAIDGASTSGMTGV